MPSRRVIGFLIATIGVLLGAFFTVAAVALLISFWSADASGSTGSRTLLLAGAVIGALIGYGVHVLGRVIAR